MGFATHLGPWLLGTVKNTTGTTSGTIRNTAPATVATTIPLTFSAINASLTGTIGAIPAGALILGVDIYTSTVFSAATTLKITIGGTDVNTAATITTVGVSNVAISNAFTPIATNVGSTDALITITATKAATLTTGSATVVVRYVVRNSDGASAPTAFEQ